MKVEVGDIIHQRFDIYQNLVAMINNYNTDVAIPNKTKKISFDKDVIEQGSWN